MTVSPSRAELAEELKRLRQTVERLEAGASKRCVVKLKSLRELYFLGQPVVVTAMVCGENNGLPLVDVPVTFVATWGKLHAIGGQSSRHGNTLTTRTDANGMADVILLPQTAEVLSQEQQNALETALQYLDGQAATPGETVTGFQKVVQHYQWDVEKQLIQAVDIYFKEFSQSLLETINFPDHMFAWSYFDSTVMAYIFEEDTETANALTVKGVGALNLLLKDWLGPWLQTYLASAESESLRKEVLEAKEWGEGEADAILDGIYDRISTYFDKQQGIAGRYVGEKVVENTMREFLQTDLNDLPLEAQVGLFPGIRAVGGATAFTGAHTLLTATRQTRVAFDSFRTRLSRQANQSLKGIQQTFVDESENFLKSFKAEAYVVQKDGLEKFGRDIDSARGERLIGFKGDMGIAHSEALAGYENDLGLARTDGLTEFRADIGKVRSDGLTQFQEDIGKSRSDGLTQFRSDVGQVQSDGLMRFQSDIDTNRKFANADFAETAQATRLKALNQFNEDINSAQAAKTAALKSDLQRAKDQTTRSFMEDLNTALAQQLETTVRNELSSKVGVETFNNALTGKVDTALFNVVMNQKLDKTTFSQFSKITNDNIAALQLTSDRISRDLSGVNATTTQLTKDVSSLNVTSTQLTQDVSAMKTTSAKLSGDVSVLKTKSDQLSKDVVRLDDSITRVGNNTLTLRNDVLRSGTLTAPITPVIR